VRALTSGAPGNEIEGPHGDCHSRRAGHVDAVGPPGIADPCATLWAPRP
jgi:hypothetical protein